MMLVGLMVLSVYYIGSALSENERINRTDSTITYETQKNYLSPISVSSFPVGKTETVNSSAALLEQQLSVGAAEELHSTFSDLVQHTEGVKNQAADLYHKLRSAVTAQKAEQIKQEKKESNLLISDTLESYEQDQYQQEADNTIQDLFNNLFVTNDSKIEQYLNVRSVPNGEVIGRMEHGTGGNVLEIQDGWARVQSGEVDGWVSVDYIVMGEDIMGTGASMNIIVDEDFLKLRREASVDSDAIESLVKGTVLGYTSYEAGWVGVSYNGMSGFVKAEYVHLEAGSCVAETMADVAAKEAAQAEAEAAAQAAAEAEAAAQAAAEAEAAAQAAAEAEAAAQAAAATPTPDELARQQIDAIYAQGRSTMAPIYLSADEIYLMSCVIMMEAGSEAYEGKLAVAGVILNRLRSGAWGSTLSQVIYAPAQFTGAGTGLLASIMASGPNAECVQAAYEACAGVHNIGGYMFFNSARTANYGAYSSYVVIDKQCFYAK
jgi:spore germination cell wall hydrolase CwlJ-like protein